jgi:hypothetical protein
MRRWPRSRLASRPRWRRVRSHVEPDEGQHRLSTDRGRGTPHQRRTGRSRRWPRLIRQACPRHRGSPANSKDRPDYEERGRQPPVPFHDYPHGSQRERNEHEAGREQHAVQIDAVRIALLPDAGCAHPTSVNDLATPRICQRASVGGLAPVLGSIPNEQGPERPVLCCLAPLAAAPSNPQELASFAGIQVSRGSPPSACRPIEKEDDQPADR